MSSARPAPRCGHGRHVGRYVLDPDFLEAGCPEQCLVDARSREDELAHRPAACEHLVAPDHPGEGDRVGEEHAAPRTQHAVPLAEHLRTLVHVVDRVDAQQRVEAPVVERQGFARVASHEPRTVGEPLLSGCGVRRGDARIVHVDAGHAAAGLTSHEQRGSARSACDLEHVALRVELEPSTEGALLIGRQPRVLADLLAERLGSDRLVELVGEACVGLVIELAAAAGRLLVARHPATIHHSVPILLAMPPVLWHLEVSHYNEKARWALDYKGSVTCVAR